MTGILHRTLLALLLALACVYTYKLEVPETRTWPAAGVAFLSARAGNGHISVTAAPDTLITALITRRCYGRNKADAESAIRNVAVTDTVAGGELALTAEMPGGNRNYGAYYDITAPAATRLALQTTNGAISATGLVSGIAAWTSNSGIELTGTAGTASLATTNGKVIVRVHSGAASITTSNGKVECDLAGLGPTEDAAISTTNGKVTLFLPADVSAGFDAATTNGEVTVSGFGTVTYDVSERTHKRGRIGSGASSVNIKTSNADILIRAR